MLYWPWNIYAQAHTAAHKNGVAYRKSVLTFSLIISLVFNLVLSSVIVPMSVKLWY